MKFEKFDFLKMYNEFNLRFMRGTCIRCKFQLRCGSMRLGVHQLFGWGGEEWVRQLGGLVLLRI